MGQASKSQEHWAYVGNPERDEPPLPLYCSPKCASAAGHKYSQWVSKENAKSNHLFMGAKDFCSHCGAPFVDPSPATEPEATSDADAADIKDPIEVLIRVLVGGNRIVVVTKDGREWFECNRNWDVFGRVTANDHVGVLPGSGTRTLRFGWPEHPVTMSRAFFEECVLAAKENEEKKGS